MCDEIVLTTKLMITIQLNFGIKFIFDNKISRIISVFHFFFKSIQWVPRDVLEYAYLNILQHCMYPNIGKTSLSCNRYINSLIKCEH